MLTGWPPAPPDEKWIAALEKIARSGEFDEKGIWTKLSAVPYYLESFLCYPRRKLSLPLPTRVPVPVDFVLCDFPDFPFIVAGVNASSPDFVRGWVDEADRLLRVGSGWHVVYRPTDALKRAHLHVLDERGRIAIETVGPWIKKVEPDTPPRGLLPDDLESLTNWPPPAEAAETEGGSPAGAALPPPAPEIEPPPPPEDDEDDTTFAYP